MAAPEGWRGGPGTHPFATGAWRAPGNNTNTFARESHIDILAVQADIDPVDFRLRNLKDKKMRRVLETTANHFGWLEAGAPSGRGQGVALGIDAGTYVGLAAEVDVDRATGKVAVQRLVCAQDMGLAINPEGATIQMEGCLTMGLGYALAEEMRFVRDQGCQGGFREHTAAPQSNWAMLNWMEVKLQWDVDLDPVKLRRQFIEGYYGPAAADINVYLKVTHDAVEASGDWLGCFSQRTAKFLNFQTLAEGWKHLQAAEEAVKDNPDLRFRVQVAQLPVTLP